MRCVCRYLWLLVASPTLDHCDCDHCDWPQTPHISFSSCGVPSHATQYGPMVGWFASTILTVKFVHVVTI